MIQSDKRDARPDGPFTKDGKLYYQNGRHLFSCTCIAGPYAEEVVGLFARSHARQKRPGELDAKIANLIERLDKKIKQPTIYPSEDWLTLGVEAMIVLAEAGAFPSNVEAQATSGERTGLDTPEVRYAPVASAPSTTQTYAVSNELPVQGKWCKALSTICNGINGTASCGQCATAEPAGPVIDALVKDRQSLNGMATLLASARSAIEPNAEYVELARKALRRSTRCPVFEMHYLASEVLRLSRADGTTKAP